MRPTRRPGAESFSLRADRSPTPRERALLAGIVASGPGITATSPGSEAVGRFVLPMLRAGLNPGAAVRLLDQVPPEWHLDHREIYYDFRLRRWCRHIEPPTLEECLSTPIHKYGHAPRRPRRPDREARRAPRTSCGTQARSNEARRDASAFECERIYELGY